MSRSSTPDFLDDWICDVCKQKPVNSITLEEQLLPGDTAFLVDSNSDIWLFCWGCRLKFHLRCVEDSPFEISGPRYYCCYCENV